MTANLHFGVIPHQAQGVIDGIFTHRVAFMAKNKSCDNPQHQYHHWCCGVGKIGSYAIGRGGTTPPCSRLSM
jgi:hypothetical protein